MISVCLMSHGGNFPYVIICEPPWEEVHRSHTDLIPMSLIGMRVEWFGGQFEVEWLVAPQKA